MIEKRYQPELGGLVYNLIRQTLFSDYIINTNKYCNQIENFVNYDDQQHRSFLFKLFDTLNENKLSE